MGKKQTTVYLEEDMIERLKEIAKARRWSLNTLIVYLLEKTLEKPQPNGK